MIPTEILQAIFSHLSYVECYNFRSVCRRWKQEIEYHVFHSIKCRQQKLFVLIKKDIVASLLPYHFDSLNNVMEFLPPDGIPTEIPVTTYIKLLFSEWKDHDDLVQYRDLQPEDLAQLLFHSTYNSSKEQLYEMPSPLASDKVRYIGDPGIILSFSYKTQGDNTILYFHGVCVHMSWILSGMDSRLRPHEIYADRYLSLTSTLHQRGIDRYNNYSEPVLQYIVDPTSEGLDTLLSEMSTNRQPFIRQQLQSVLRAHGIDPRVIWKYTFVKTYILTGGWANSHVMDVIQSIQESEKKWQRRKKRLLKFKII